MMSDVAGELERLAELKDRGILTQEEFDQQKAALLHPSTAPTAILAPPPAYAAPAYVAPVSNNRSLLFAALGLVGVIAGAAILWATGVLRLPGSASTTAFTGSSGFNASAPAPAPTAAIAPAMSANPVAPSPTPAVADNSWILGQWENVATPACAQWIRFGADHSLGDNGNSTGTWSLAANPDGTYLLAMDITGTGLRQGPITRDESAGTITMGSGSNTVTWRKTTCS